jgi:hypothetical protein
MRRLKWWLPVVTDVIFVRIRMFSIGLVMSEGSFPSGGVAVRREGNQPMCVLYSDLQYPLTVQVETVKVFRTLGARLHFAIITNRCGRQSQATATHLGRRRVRQLSVWTRGHL